MQQTQTFADRVSIGIATKNRWPDLKTTLQRISASNLKNIPIFIFDDASDLACPFNLAQFPLQVNLRRFETSQGYIARRNQLAQIMTTKYYLSLDDDSYPVSGSLQSALEFAEANERELLCLSFPIYNPVLGKPQNVSLQSEPYQVRSFIGCGHLLHLDHFLELGGYSEELTHQGEEMDIAARGFQRGFHCYHFPDLEIHHTASSAERNWHRMDYYGARNNVFWNDWFMPPHLRAIKQIRTLASRSMLGLRTFRLGQFQGEVAGFRDIPRYKVKRNPMSIQVYKRWQALPHS